MLSSLIGVIVIIINLVIEVRSELTPVLSTPNGPVIGSKKTYNGAMYAEYLGIPFAQPPLGNLRWAKPQLVKPWTEPRDATKYSRHCTHFLALLYPVLGFGAENGEDCLYINVIVPGGVEDNRNRQRPVMVWVFGGGFFIGTGEMYPGHALAIHGDMIVVSFNYRVGPLGFLSTGDSELPGNYGLWDQNAAFKWVKDNIAAFGGDPNRVTIFGQSAGGASVSHDVISPRNAGLFQNAISISGGSSAYFATTNRSLEAAMILGELCGCNSRSSKELATCLRRQDAAVLDFNGVLLIMLVTKKVMNFVPVIDGDYVPIHPKQAFERGAGKDINFMTGSTYDELGGFVILNPLSSPLLKDYLNMASTTATMKILLQLVLGPVANLDEAYDEIVKVYPGMGSWDLTTRTKAFTRALTDFVFAAASNWEAQRHSTSSGSGKTYQYRFKYYQSFLTGYPDWFKGSHLDDLYSSLGDPYLKTYRDRSLMPDYSDADKVVRNTIMDYYSNFAHTGDPNEGPFSPLVPWEEFQTSKQNHLEQSEHSHMESFDSDSSTITYKFWTDVFPGILKFPPQPKFPPPAGILGTVTGLLQSTIVETELTAGLLVIKNLVRGLVPAGVANDLVNFIDEMMAKRSSLLGLLK